MPISIKGGKVAPSSRTCGTCGLYAMCRLDQKKYLSIKDHGAQNLGYRIICDKTEGHAAKEDYCTCFNFVESIQGRMINGDIQRAQGKDGEIIRIIKREGEEISQRSRMGFNALGEIVRPRPGLVADLKRAGYKVSTSDHAGIVSWRDVVYTTRIPLYSELMQAVNSYDELLARREMEQQEAESDVADTAWAEAQKRMGAADAAVANKVQAEPVGKRA